MVTKGTDNRDPENWTAIEPHIASLGYLWHLIRSPCHSVVLALAERCAKNSFHFSNFSIPTAEAELATTVMFHSSSSIVVVFASLVLSSFRFPFVTQIATP